MIKTWKRFRESVSGTTDTVSFGPNYGSQKLQTTLSKQQTTTLSDKQGNFYTQDDYDELYDNILKLHKDYLIKSGIDLMSLKQFNKENLNFIIDIMK